MNLKSGIDSSSDPLLVLTNVADTAGNWAIPDNHLGISIIHIEEERIVKSQQTAFINESGNVERYNPELKINLYVLITANYTGSENESNEANYIEGLKQLSNELSFFQQKAVFTPANSPLLAAEAPNISKLIVELYPHSFETLYNFWTVVGAKYLPSVLYRLRVVEIQEKAVQEQAPAVSGM